MGTSSTESLPNPSRERPAEFGRLPPWALSCPQIQRGWSCYVYAVDVVVCLASCLVCHLSDGSCGKRLVQANQTATALVMRDRENGCTFCHRKHQIGSSGAVAAGPQRGWFLAAIESAGNMLGGPLGANMEACTKRSPLQRLMYVRVEPLKVWRCERRALWSLRVRFMMALMDSM